MKEDKKDLAAQVRDVINESLADVLGEAYVAEPKKFDLSSLSLLLLL